MDWKITNGGVKPVKRKVSDYVSVLLFACLFVWWFGWRALVVVISLAVSFGIFWELRNIRIALTPRPASRIEQSNLTRTGWNLSKSQIQRLGQERPLLYRCVSYRIGEDGSVPELPIDLKERLQDWLAKA